MTKPGGTNSRYEWMLKLSAEGWAWEFLRRNPDYRRDYYVDLDDGPGASAHNASYWGLLKFVDPDQDARSAAVFWSSDRNPFVLTLLTAGAAHANSLSGIKCNIAVLKLAGSDVQHVLFGREGRFYSCDFSVPEHSTMRIL